LILGASAAEAQQTLDTRFPLLRSNFSAIISDSALMEAARSIRGERLAVLIDTLASDSFAGRATGSAGYDRAARWVAEKLVRAGVRPLPSLESLFQRFKLPTDDVRSRVHLDDPGTDSILTANVVGWLPGSDDSLSREFIAVTAHLDHLGRKGDSVFYGANDNASGVSVLLTVAQSMADHAVLRRRSILFVAFSGEEIGLKGSEYFVHHAPVPLSSIGLLINLDLVGSGKEGLMLQGLDVYPGHWRRFEEINGGLGFELKTRPNSPNSDHYHFHMAGVPAVFIYAYNGTVPYHSVLDRPERLDRGVLENVARFVLLSAWSFANR
jgi:hypothetical protein